MTAIVDLDAGTALELHDALGPDSVVLPSMEALRRHLDIQFAEDAVVLGPTVDLVSALALAESMRVSRPSLGVILVRRYVDTTVLADAMRVGVFEVVEERDVAALTAAVGRSHDLARALRETVIQAPEPEDGAGRGTLITVFSAKGGCGKTTLATNLAAALADGGRREVCLVDLDLAFGDVAIALQLFPAHTIADAVPLAASLDAQALLSLLTPHSPGFTTLVAPIEPGSADAIPASLVSTILALLKKQFDYVVVDTPPAFDDHVLAAFDQSDIVALLATLDIPALKNLKLTLETLDLLNYPRERWRIVLNRSDSKVGLALSEVEKTLKVPIAVQVPSSRDVPASVNRGVPIMLDDPRHPVSQAIKAFAERQIVAHAVAAGSHALPEMRADRRGLLRRKARTT
ncbi:MAG: pilus assembly protein CpaE [Actinomycetota bacterium]|jgi:pilus assembly protein CpaE|nr:pilus assembly protein CpaE [Actinomycetota bacterium]